jgi:hypothetical protein
LILDFLQLSCGTHIIKIPTCNGHTPWQLLIKSKHKGIKINLKIVNVQFEVDPNFQAPDEIV